MLFQAPDASAPLRLQGVYVSDHEIQRLVEKLAIRGSPHQPCRGKFLSGLRKMICRADCPLHQAPLWEEEAKKKILFWMRRFDLVRREGRLPSPCYSAGCASGYTRAARLLKQWNKRKSSAPCSPIHKFGKCLISAPSVPLKITGNDEGKPGFNQGFPNVFLLNPHFTPGRTTPGLPPPRLAVSMRQDAFSKRERFKPASIVPFTSASERPPSGPTRISMRSFTAFLFHGFQVFT